VNCEERATTLSKYGKLVCALYPDCKSPLCGCGNQSVARGTGTGDVPEGLWVCDDWPDCKTIIKLPPDPKAKDRAMRSPVNLDHAAAGLHILYRVYLLAEPEGDTETFLSWMKDELEL
jgi:ssDNA-binding Zn-finger/Zn-ribbon topoisomerase 1